MNQTTIGLNSKNWLVNLRDEADQSVFNEIFKLREYRSAEEIIIKAADPIVDVGAHAGFFSLYCRALNNKVKIFALEPEKNNFEMLKSHLKENKIVGVKPIFGALASETGERLLLISEDSHNHRLAQPGEEGKLVPVFSLSDFCDKNHIKKISLLKMDVEGAEFEIFDSLTAVDFSKINSIIMEYHNSHGKNFQTIEARLRENGFGVQIFPSHFDKNMGFLLARNKRNIKYS